LGRFRLPAHDSRQAAKDKTANGEGPNGERLELAAELQPFAVTA
jgi:hypothetical protein